MPEAWERADVTVDEDLARRLVAACAPALRAERVALLDEGWDSRAFAVGEDWIFRFPKRRGAHGSLGIEIALLPELARTLPVAIPRFVHIGHASDDYPYRFVGYRRVPGVESQRAWGSFEPVELGGELGAVLSALHAYPLEAALRAGVEHDRWSWEQSIDEFVARLSTEEQEAMAVLREPPAPYAGAPRLVHGDVMPYHLLVDGGRLSGLIDWGDVTLGDPARDFAGVFFIGGTAALESCLARYAPPIDDGARERARYIALRAAAIELVWGRASDRPTVVAAAERALRFCQGC